MEMPEFTMLAITSLKESFSLQNFFKSNQNLLVINLNHRKIYKIYFAYISDQRFLLGLILPFDIILIQFKTLYVGK